MVGDGAEARPGERQRIRRKHREILIKLLRESSPTGVEREKAARAVSRFAFCDGDGDGEADAVEANQQALFDVGGVELVVSLIEPLHYEEPPLPTADQVRGKLGAAAEDSEEEEEVVEEEVDPNKGEHHLIHKWLANALWSMSVKNRVTQIAIAEAGGISLLIKLLTTIQRSIVTRPAHFGASHRTRAIRS